VWRRIELSCNPMEVVVEVNYYFCDDAIGVFYLE
jgi:hypothetical protein